MRMCYIILCVFTQLVYGVGAVRIQTNHVDSVTDLDICKITDGDSSSCAVFAPTNGHPWITDLSVSVDNYVQNVGINVVLNGTNLGCHASHDAKLYVMMVSEENRAARLNTAKTCALQSSAAGFCSYTCSCDTGDCDAVRLIRRPKSQASAEWKLCEMAPVNYAPDACTRSAVGADGGGHSSDRCSHWTGNITRVEIDVNTVDNVPTRLRVKYGDVYGSHMGYEPNTAPHAFDILPGEFITQVTAYKENVGNFYVVTGLKIYTNQGQIHGLYGKTGVDVVQMEGERATYIEAYSGTLINTVVVHFQKC